MEVECFWFFFFFEWSLGSFLGCISFSSRLVKPLTNSPLHPKKRGSVVWNLCHTPLNPRTLWSMFVRLTELTVARSVHLRPGRRDYSLSLSVKSEPFKSAQLVLFFFFCFFPPPFFSYKSLFIKTYCLHRFAQHKHSAKNCVVQHRQRVWMSGMNGCRFLERRSATQCLLYWPRENKKIHL